MITFRRFLAVVYIHYKLVYILALSSLFEPCSSLRGLHRRLYRSLQTSPLQLNKDADQWNDGSNPPKRSLYRSLPLSPSELQQDTQQLQVRIMVMKGDKLSEQ